MKIAVAAAVLLSCRAAPPASTEEAMPRPVHVAHPEVLASEPPPLGKLPPDEHALHEALALTLDPAGADTYPGTARIDVQLDRPRTVIWLHGRGLDVVSARVGDQVARYEQVDPIGVAKLVVERPVSGKATLVLEFHAHYDPQLVGVYRSHGAVFSKFEAIYARRAFPCFDEPRFKIPFDVTLDVPLGADVVANTPPEDADDRGGRRKLSFHTTPALPTYLLAFAVGDFDLDETVLPPNELRAVPLPIRTVTIAGRGAAGAFARAEAAKLVEAEEHYFGIAFPFAKLDLVAVPDFQSGAMENAGAIFFRDAALLAEPASTSLAQRMTIVDILAHELAHQWFGDLVTMPWWDDLWLNEGFATFLATRAVATVRPEYESGLAAVGSANRVMGGDSLAAARRIRQPIATTDDITNAFDDITYSKGAAVLAMLEHAIGDDAFRRGLHEYLTAHARGNATTTDLVTALSKAAGRDLAPIAASFLDQPGVPSIAARAVCEAGQGRVELAQSRWQPAGETLAAVPWTVPVCVKAGVGGRVVEACATLTARTGSLALPGCADWVMPNARAAGYYRSSQGAAGLAALRDRGAAQLETSERLALAYDLEAGFRSGEVPGADALAALDALAADPHPMIAGVPLATYDFVRANMSNDRERAALGRHVQRVYAPAVRALGWRAKPGEAPVATLARSMLLVELALDFGDAALLRDGAARGRAMLDLAPPVPFRDAVAPDVVGFALGAAARTGDAKVFDAILARAVASDDAQARRRLFAALGMVRDPALVARALDLALDPRLRPTERLAFLGAFGAEPETRDAAWAWLVASYDRLAPLLPDRFGGYLPGLFAPCDRARRDVERAFLAPRMATVTGGPRNLAQALERSEQCEARVEAQRASVAAYLAKLR